MTVFDLLGGSYQQRFVETNPQRTVNWYPIVSSQTEKNKTQTALYLTPGLTTYVTLPGRYGRALFTMRTHLYTKCFAVVDNVLYEVAVNGTYSTVGTMTNMSIGSTKVFMECNLQNELLIAAYDATYVYDVDTATLSQVTDSDFPNNVTSATYLDQYMIVAANGAVFESLTSSALNWDSTQTYSPTFKSAPVIAVGAIKEQIFNFTTETIEVFINDGTSPYSRLPRTSMLVGIKAKDSLATFANGFVFLGKSRNGGTAVFYYDGWNDPQPISDQSITDQINKAETLDDVYGYIEETKDGHFWYYLNIPSLNDSLVYDFVSKQWHNRRSTNPSVDADGVQRQGMFRGACLTSFNDMNLFLDTYSGKVFKESYTTYTEDSNFIYRERITQEISEEDKYISHIKVSLDVNTGQALSSGQGSAPVLMFSYSNNSSHLFGVEKQLSLGLQGNYQAVVKINQLGSSRKRVYKISMTDPVPVIIQNAYLDAIVGNH